MSKLVRNRVESKVDFFPEAAGVCERRMDVNSIEVMRVSVDGLRRLSQTRSFSVSKSLQYSHFIN